MRYTPPPSYEPTPQEIEEACRRIRTQGFHDGIKQRKPWPEHRYGEAQGKPGVVIVRHSEMIAAIEEARNS